MKVMTPIILKRPVQVIRSPGTKLCIIRKPYAKFVLLLHPVGTTISIALVTATVCQQQHQQRFHCTQESNRV
jgi:hypothetical protein